jgi:hypothetical protein
MNTTELLKILQEAKRDGRSTLNLVDKGIEELPPEIGDLQNLSELNLNFNKLRSFPPEIGRLINLTALGLVRNELKELPTGIERLKGLRSLNLGGNQLSMFPMVITSLSNLTKLELYDNKLTAIPPEIIKLSNLKELSLSSNQLKEFPVEILGLKKLEILVLGDNNINIIPSEISSLSNLTEIYLGNANLCELPREIVSLKKLKTLRLDCNHLSQLPPEICLLPNLISLDMEANPLTVPPPAVAKLGVVAIKRYFESVNKDVAANNVPDFFSGIEKIELLMLDLQRQVEMAKNDHDVFRCDRTLKELDNLMCPEEYDASTVKQFSDKLIQALLTLLSIRPVTNSGGHFEGHDAAIITLSNIVAVTTRAKVSWDENHVQTVLTNQLRQINDEVGKNPDVYTLLRGNVACAIAHILEKLTGPTQETLKELDRLRKWPFAESEPIRSVAEKALNNLSKKPTIKWGYRLLKWLFKDA